MTTIILTAIDGIGTVTLTGQDAHERNVSLRHMLKEHLCEVTFTKLDGAIRTMPCTLKESMLPAKVDNEGAKTKVPNEANLSVWCTDKGEWRSFKTANVIEVKILS